MRARAENPLPSETRVDEFNHGFHVYSSVLNVFFFYGPCL